MQRISVLIALASLTGCATHYTVDDGRKVDEKLLQQIRTYAGGLQAIRPAIVRSADLHDKDCSTQWELPFETATTYSLSDTDSKVAWIRGAGIDEHLRVVASSPVADLQAGDVIVDIDGYESDNAVKMAKELASMRDKGRSFEVKLSTGKRIKVAPLEVCRGRTLLAAPGKDAEKQDYHWLQSIHPQQVAAVNLTPQEAQWIVLWTQGLSEEGGIRMKAYTYGLGFAKLVATAALAVATAGVGVAAAGSAAAAGGSIGSLLGAAAVAQAPLLVATAATNAAANAASLHGVSWVASTVFDRADRWAFERMKLLDMNPGVALELEKKLAAANAARNAFLLDEPRQQQMESLVASLPVHGEPAQSEQAAISSVSGHDIAQQQETTGLAVKQDSLGSVPGLAESTAPALADTLPAPPSQN